MKRYTLLLIIVSVVILALGICYFLNRNKISDVENNFGYIEKDAVSTVYQQKASWEETKNDISGNYETGFCFIDIDLDGKKELAVQLGGDYTGNCITKFYKIEGNNVKPYYPFEEKYSISVGSLKEYVDAQSNIFYINQRTINTGNAEYTTYYDVISSGAKMKNLYRIKSVYLEDGAIERVYYADSLELPQEEYDERFNSYFSKLTEKELYLFFVPFKTWKRMSETEQLQNLGISYGISKTSYLEQISENTFEKIDCTQYQPIDISLSEAVYGNELTEIKKSLGNDVPAQVYTDHNSFIYFVPASDMLDNMIYYYKNGKIVAYVREFSGIGGSVTYYFNNGKLLKIDESGIELEMEFKAEDSTAIIIRSESAWNEYGR